MIGPRNREIPETTAKDAAFQVPRHHARAGARLGDMWAVPAAITRRGQDVVFDTVPGMDIRRTPPFEVQDGENIALSLRGQQVNLRVFNPNSSRNGPSARGQHIALGEAVDVDAAIVLITQARRYMEQRVAIQEPNTQGSKYPGLLILGTDSPEIKDRLLEMADEADTAEERNYIGNRQLYEISANDRRDDPAARRFIFHTTIYPTSR